LINKKDNLTIEKVDELPRLAKKFTDEYWDKEPDPWKVPFYVAVVNEATYKKYGKELAVSLEMVGR